MCQYRKLATRHLRDGSLREHQAILAALRTNNSAATKPPCAITWPPRGER